MGLRVMGTRVMVAAPNHDAEPTGVFLPMTSLRGRHGNGWRCFAHKAGLHCRAPQASPPQSTHGWGGPQQDLLGVCGQHWALGLTW